MVFVVAIVVSAAFGGADQYLGSFAALPWAAGVSLLSAPWLILPFAFGCSQRQARRAIAMGAVVTFSALVGYFVMTLSPFEGGRSSLDLVATRALLRSELPVIVGGVVTGPLYGWLGQRWRTRRAWLSAALVAGAVCLEPLAEAIVGRLPQEPIVWRVEVASGVALAALFVVAGVVYRHRVTTRGLESGAAA